MALAAVAPSVQGCAPDVLVGTWTCAGVTSASDGATSGGTADAGSPLSLPWSDGFEDGFCSYPAIGGFCYATTGGSYRMVTSPVHSGRFAAAFTVDSSAGTASQTRCSTQGMLPTAANYGAWYFIPALHTNSGNWNLFHFDGGQRGSHEPSLFDVSLDNDASGNLNLKLLNWVSSPSVVPPDLVLPVPIGAWFHIQVYFRRATDATGEVIVYQDGVSIYHATNIVTDRPDSDEYHWYVGNFASSIAPPQSVIYVDDIEISGAP